MAAIPDLPEELRPLAQLADAMADLLTVADTSGRILFISRVAERLLGHRPEELVGRCVFDLLHPEDAGRVRATRAQWVASGEPTEARTLQADGTWRWLENRACLNRIAGKTYVVSIARDIQARKETEAGIRQASFLDRQRADEALRRSREGFRTLIEEAPDTILLHRNGLLVYGNAVLRKLLGVETVEELVGRQLSSFTHPDDREMVERHLRGQAGAADWRSPPTELRMLCADGKERIHEMVSLTLTYEGEPTIIAIGRDLTERREMQLRLQLADRMVSVGTLAAGVAHELNNPLAYVMANLQFLEDELRAFEPHLEGTEAAPRLRTAEDALREAQEGAARLRVIVRNLGAFSRGDGEARGPIDLRTVVESSLNMALNEIRHRATVVRDLQPVPPVFGNQARLGQVVLNLLVNAAQAIPEGKASQNRIEVRTAFAGGMVRLEVSDTGQGIPAQVLGRIFDPFFTTKAPGVGTGLGLSICHSIVASMEGRIEVESTPSRGSCFRVLLPPTEVVLEPAPKPAPAARSSRGRLLVVDDEPLVGMALRRALQKDHEVTVLQSGRRAQELLATGEPFDAVISDLLMPDCTGMELYQSLLMARPDLARRTLFLTGGAFTEAAREFLARPEIRALEKPFEVEELRQAVRSMLSDEAR